MDGVFHRRGKLNYRKCGKHALMSIENEHMLQQSASLKPHSIETMDEIQLFYDFITMCVTPGPEFTHASGIVLKNLWVMREV